MNRDEILNMDAGREMDALIAENVDGWNKSKHYTTKGDTDILVHPTDGSILPNDYPHYSTDISAAWEVVDALKNKRYANGDYYSSTYFNLEFFEGSWVAKFKASIPNSNGGIVSAKGNTPELAICRAALLVYLQS